MNVDRIIDTYHTATDAEIENGRNWYHAAHTFCQGLAERYGVTIDVAAAVVAILSPRTEWGLNMRYADQYLRTGDAPTFFSTKAKLARIVAGESIDDVQKGRKVRSFYSNILSPDTSQDVTIDRHAYDIVAGTSDDEGRKALDRKGAYDATADLYRCAADTLGLRPHEVQAVTWLAHKRTKEYAHAQHRTLYQTAR